jgi:serine/threonine-protein kinase HipA
MREAWDRPVKDGARQDRLEVTYRGFVAGHLEATSEGLVFTYHPRWLATRGALPLSLTMPLSEFPYADAVVGPWVANLLPEEAVGRAFARALGVSAGDGFAMLREAGSDTAGAFSFEVPATGENREDNGFYEPVVDYVARHREKGGAKDRGLEPTAEAGALRALLGELAERPFFVDEEGVRLSLAGGQVKTALAAIDAAGRPTLALGGEGVRFAVPYGTAASTLIVKPDNPKLLGIVEIEAYCLALAACVGLETPAWRILAAEDRIALAVARFDRTIVERRDGTAEVRRLHQEDFCQLLGYEPRRKYETAAGGGARLADLIGVAKRYLEPRDRLRFLDYVVFNILVGNTDAHAKNYSVLVGENGARLAPIYDVNSVLAWDHVHQRHAQKIAGKSRRPADIARRHWEAIAGESGLNARELVKRVDELATAIVHERSEAIAPVLAAKGVTPRIVEDISERIDAHARRIQGRLAER